MAGLGLRRGAHLLSTLLLTSTMLTAATSAFAQAAKQDEVIVTAQKREENVQKVPLSIQAIGTAKLEQLQVANFNDYVKFLPSVAYQTAGPGYANVYIRGVASGENNNHSGPLPSVGMYLDEQPITTIGGALDIHVYDIARVEELSGPQGTLYGASSEAGTIRIISNKPQIGVFKGAYDIEVNDVAHGDVGYSAEGFVNIPVNDKAAIRLVGWGVREGGYIDNVAGTDVAGGIINGVRTFPTASSLAGVPIASTVLAKNNYNNVDTYGGRAALKIDLDENWTVTPTLMAQRQLSYGNFSYDPHMGDLKVGHFLPESNDDRWYQAALTIEGRVSNFDITYAGSFLDRNIKSYSDYSDYSFFYDSLYGSYVYDKNGAIIDPDQAIWGKDHFTKQSHELRIASPKDDRFRVVGGVFFQRQTHAIEQRYVITNLSPAISITGWPDTWWLTREKRTDRDYAAFAEASFDLTPKLTITGGIRGYIADNGLKGFFGLHSYEALVPTKPSHPACLAVVIVANTPCTNLNQSVKETGETHKVNLTYQIDPNHMVYATYSTGFRPGGVNRNSILPPYRADTLTNYEIGWKTMWLEGALRFNGALFLEDWSDIQFSTIPPGSSGLTQIFNAGQARIMGIESDFSWRPVQHFTLSGSAAYTHAELTQDYCQDTNNCVPPSAAKGSQLPVTPKFKANGTARYEFSAGPLDAHLQGSVVYQSSAWPDLIATDRAVIGQMPAFTTADFEAGVGRDNWTVELSLLNAFDSRGQNNRYTECSAANCAPLVYVTPIRPRLVAVKFGQKF